jgi:amino acid adenylation domain-containing protein
VPSRRGITAIALDPIPQANRLSSVGAHPAPAEDRPDVGCLGEDCWLPLPDPPLDLNGPTSVPYAPFDARWIERPIFDLFERVANQFSDRIAVDDGVRHLTYRQVWDGARRLAQAIATTLATGRPVGVLLPNEAYYPIAVLGCLAAACPCVVLDRHYPAGRNLAIIRDAGLAAIVVAAADEKDEGLYPAGLAAIAIDPAVDPMAAPPLLLRQKLLPDDPAVIVYTSGSTGAPKGIVLSQRAILHRARQLINSVHLNAADRVLPLGSPCTVAGIQQMLETLLAGAMLVKLDLQRAGFGVVLATIKDKRVTVLAATPVLLRAVTRLNGVGGMLGSLRCVHPSGDVLLAADLTALRQCLPRSCDIIVVYGLTEAPAICQWFVPRDVAEEEARVAVGFRLPGYDCTVLDEDDRPVGFEETGELVTRSRFTALGEWRGGHVVPGRFTRDPSDPSLRILRTGDLVRVRRDGVIVVVGRKDRQVKIRGMRVEPYEIESALRRSPAVLDAAVVARHDGEDATLVAFVVLRSDEGERAIEALRTHLRASLPAYMQPARIIPLAALPLLPGHKVDTDALLALDDARSPDNPAVMPSITVETKRSRELVAQAWCRILDRSSLDADIPFDQAGGDSLGLLQLVFHLETLCAVPLPLSAFDVGMRPSEAAHALDQILAGSRRVGNALAVATVHEVATPAAAAAEGAIPRSSPLVLLKPDAQPPPVFITHSLRGHVGEFAELGKHLRSRHPIYALQARGLDGTPALDRIEDMAQYFLDSMEAVQPHGPYLLIGHSIGGLVMLELAQRLSGRGEEVALLVLLDTYPHPRFWPVRPWIRFLWGRTRRHVSAVTQLRRGERIPYLAQLSGSVVNHLLAHWGSSRRPGWNRTAEPPSLERIRDGLAVAETRYRPRYYPGRITFLKSEIRGARERVADHPIMVWGTLAREFEVLTVAGDHVSMVAVHAEALGAQLTRCLERALGGSG